MLIFQIPAVLSGVCNRSSKMTSCIREDGSVILQQKAWGIGWGGGGERGGSLKDDPWRAFLIRNLSLNFENKFCKQVKAQTLWSAIIDSQIETGTPYMLYKDACNSKSNQQNLGTIKCSNLCTEIVEYSAPDEVS